MSLPLSPEQRAARWGTIARWAAIGVIGFLVSPFVFKAITGLAGLIAVGIIIGVTWTLLPAVTDMAKNMRLKLIKAEAARNPIETLEQEYLRRTQLLNERTTKVETLDAKTRGFGSKLAQFKRDYPSEAPTFQEVYDKMTLLVKRSREQLTLANRQLNAFEGEITKAKAKWAMALAAADLRQDAGSVEADFLAKLKVECSFETIESGMNSTFAQLDTLLMEGDNVEINVTGTAPVAALPAPSSVAIDASELVQPTTVKTKVAR